VHLGLDWAILEQYIIDAVLFRFGDDGVGLVELAEERLFG
jgi:hypothetical protein